MVEEVLATSRLTLIFEEGVDENGEPQYKTKSFTTIRPTATPEELYTVAQALAALSVYPLMDVERTDTSDIVSA
ncbi:DUF1659 domain-containing protein [Bacillus fonticola]|uniref:DUF1659 domain-containing protein n=1 Tax=Bacillus fonticola TaxID=2728853 RepID=UPI001472748C|nr:DUF1659 domain-containing protein [Bacillus fonticola]